MAGLGKYCMGGYGRIGVYNHIGLTFTRNPCWRRSSLPSALKGQLMKPFFSPKKAGYPEKGS